MLNKVGLFFILTVVLFLLAALLYFDPSGFLTTKGSPLSSADDVKAPDYEDVSVLVVSYLPVKSGKLDPSLTGIDSSLSSIRTKVEELTADGIEALTHASAYHGYKDDAAESFLRYSVLESKEFSEAMPSSKNEIPWNPGVYRPDYKKILNGLDICDYVDSKGVRQVWLWSYHHGKIEPSESNMAMGTVSKKFWNVADYGDVSNSERINDLPVCENTYTLFNYNYARGLGEMLENHTHQLEALFSFVGKTLWDKFTNPYGETAVINHCGWTHCPPNAKQDYDWANETSVLSDCEDWRPDESGTVKNVDCHTWYGETCLDDSGAGFKIWWMQNIPGKDNGLAWQSKTLRNWWEFVGDFDAALLIGKSLAY